MSHHLRKNPLQTPPVLYLYNFIGMAMRVTTVMDSLLQAGHPQDELAGEIQEPPSTLMCHAGPDWLQNQGALAMGSHWPWDVPGGLVTQLSTTGVHTHAKGRGDDLQEPSLRERLAPAPHLHSERRTGMEVMAPRGSWAPVKGILMTSSPHSTFSSFLPSSLQSSPWHTPPAPQLFVTDPGAPAGRAFLASCHRVPLCTAHHLIPVRPPFHPARGHAAQIQRTKQPQSKQERGFQQPIGSARARSQLLGKAGAARRRLSSCSIPRLEWSHPLCHN